MKTRMLNFLLIILLTTFLNGCVVVDSNINGVDFEENRGTITGSGRLITVPLGFTNFSKIGLHYAFKAQVKKSENYSVILEIDDNIQTYLYTQQSGDKISIGLKTNYSYKNVTLKATIETPDVDLLELSGASYIDLTNFDFIHDLTIESSGGSIIKGNINTGNLTFNYSGGSIIELTGRGKDLVINGSGGSTANLFNFPVINCSINLSGGSISNLNVSGRLDLYLSGGSILRYKGNPTIGNINISGGSIFQKVN